MAYSIVSTASNIKAPYKSPIVTSDSYKVTWKCCSWYYWGKYLNCRRQFSHRCTAVCTAGQFRHWWHAAAAVRPCNSQAPLQISNVKYGRACGKHAPAWCRRLYSQLESGQTPTLEPNMKGIGWRFAELWPFEIFAKCVNGPWGRSVGRSSIFILLTLISYTPLSLR